MTAIQAQTCEVSHVTDHSPRTAPAGVWWVAFIRGGIEAERTFAADMGYRGFHASVPIWDTFEYRGTSRVRVKRPVFKSYVPFLTPGDSPDDLAARYALVDLRGDRKIKSQISTILEVRDQGRFRRQLSAIEIASDNHLIVDVIRMLVPGRRVRVCKGPLQGVVGYIDAIDGGKVQLRESTVGFAALVTVPADHLEDESASN